jgi:tetratricopeptide (TPR) repeat protein
MPAEKPELAEKIQKFRRMLESDPENELALYSLGSALFDDGNFEEAEGLFGRALEHRSDWVMAYILRARCLIRLKRYAEARPLLEQGRAHSVEQQHEGPVEEIDELLEDLP